MSGQRGTLVRMAMTIVMIGIFTFLFGDAVGDRMVGALFGTLAFVSIMPVVALADDRVRTG